MSGEDVNAIAKQFIEFYYQTFETDRGELRSLYRNESMLIVSVAGLLAVDGSADPLQFTQTFHLIHDGDSHYIHNDIFRLNYGA